MSSGFREDRCDVLVVGGGTAGCAAAIQAARMGRSVILAEESPWLGGMLTAAGVSALDGNKGEMCGGILRELREFLESHYGGAARLRTGWISETSFEPNVAARQLARMAQDAGVVVWHGAVLESAHVERGRVEGAVFSVLGERRSVRAFVTIEATEWGDLLAKAEVPYRLGRESYDETGEDHAPPEADDEIQDMTFCAILREFDGTAPPVAEQAGFSASDFDGCLAEHASNPDPEWWNHRLHTWDGFLSYSRLPNGRYLLNWPFSANDHPVSRALVEDHAIRAAEFAVAKRRTLAFVRFMQRELGHPEWGLDETQFDTPDHLPFIPYVRECRRVVGVRTMKEQDVLPVDGCVRAPARADSIAVGDYYLDHHHAKSHLPPDRRLIEDYPANAPFQVPYLAIVPERMDGLLVSEKSYSVTHIVNGCSRLQPVVMAVGQAAGAAAAICAAERIEPRELQVSRLQESLLASGQVLYGYRDIGCRHPAFSTIQRLALSGFVDPSEPMTFDSDRILDRSRAERLARGIAAAAERPESESLAAFRDGMKPSEFVVAATATRPGG